MLRAIVLAFSQLPDRFKATLGLAVIVILVLIAIIADQRREAAREVREQIEEQNNDAKDAADAAQLGFDRCTASPGMFWDFAASECRRDSADPG